MPLQDKPSASTEVKKQNENRREKLHDNRCLITII